jgi:hypothetical protein
MLFRTKLGLTLAALAFAGVTLAQTPAVKPEHIRGEIVSFDGDTLKVHRRSGETVAIEVKPAVAVSAVKTIQLSDIKPGSFVGTAATTGADGKVTATEVLVFPEAARGTGEGHYPWDLSPNSTMTNANVDSIVEGTSGRDLKLSYKGGSITVTVPANVPVVTFAPATRADLTPGKKVFLVATPSQQGAFVAQRVVVEKDGVVHRCNNFGAWRQARGHPTKAALRFTETKIPQPAAIRHMKSEPNSVSAYALRRISAYPRAGDAIAAGDSGSGGVTSVIRSSGASRYVTCKRKKVIDQRQIRGCTGLRSLSARSRILHA